MNFLPEEVQLLKRLDDLENSLLLEVALDRNVTLQLINELREELETCWNLIADFEGLRF